MSTAHFFVIGAALAYAATPLQAQSTGLRSSLEIIRDHEGVPHIRAKSEADAIFGLGFVHAQDRLWQMEYLRRLGRGRLAEVLGPAALPGDKLFRTLGVAQSAEATWAGYGTRERELISAYVAGVNAATARQRNGKLPLEFLLLNFQPDLWLPEDILVIAKVLGWSVDQNWTQELLRVQLTQKVGPERAAQLMPSYSSDGPVIVPKAPSLYARRPARYGQSIVPAIDGHILSGLMALERHVQVLTGLGGQGVGSNNQVLSASRTTTGKPILAADPHLPSQIPSIFYRAHLTGGGLDVIGATAAGIPGVLMGHNGRIAWGWTNANADVQDLYLERIIDGKEVEYDGRREALRFRPEVIRVKGAADVALTVRSTRHGPLVSDLVDPNGPALALRWAASDSDDDTGIAAYLHANRARDWREFTAAFRRFKAHPQNLVYADSEGNIGYVLAGTIPVRAAGDGSAPVPGWTSQFEWKGYIPFDELPVAFNPPQGYLASSNNKIAPDTYPYKLSNSFAAPYRAARVLELVHANPRHSVRDMEQMQADIVAVHARELIPLLTGQDPVGKPEAGAIELLRTWDLKVTGESAAAALFEAWYVQLAESLFADELGSELWRGYSDQLHMVSMAMASAVRNNREWCDDVRTPAQESCQEIASQALRLAIKRMAAAQGTDNIAAWQWSKVHRTIFFHRPFDGDPLLERIFNRSTGNGGDKHTVNVASNPSWSEYDQRHIALYRQIVDLGDFRNSRWIAAPGQSGQPFDTHYDDRIEDWRQMAYRPMLFAAQAVDEQAVSRLVLLP